MLNVIMLNVIVLNVILLNVIMLNVILLNVIMLNVIMLNVVAPIQQRLRFTQFCKMNLCLEKTIARANVLAYFVENKRGFLLPPTKYFHVELK